MCRSVEPSDRRMLGRWRATGRRWCSRWAGVRSRSPTRARSTFRRPASPSSRSSATTWPWPRARCAAPAGGPNVLVRYANGIHGEFFYQKRAPEKRPDWIEVVALSFPSGRTAEEVVPRDAAALAWMANLGLPGAPPASGAGRGPRPSRRAARRPRPDAGDRVDADRRGGPRGAAGPRRRRPRGLAEDLGLARHPRQRAHPSALVVHRGAARRARPRPRGRAAGPRARHQQVVEGGAPRRLPRLQPERQGPHRRQRLLGAPEARRARLGARDLGRALRVSAGGLHAAHHARALRRHRRPARGHRRAAPARSTRCSSCRPARRPRAWATRPGRRTTPSRTASRRACSRRRGRTRPRPGGRRVSTKPLVEIARAAKKEEALPGLERWKARHPEAAASPRSLPTSSSTRCAAAPRPGPASA